MEHWRRVSWMHGVICRAQDCDETESLVGAQVTVVTRNGTRIVPLCPRCAARTDTFPVEEPVVSASPFGCRFFRLGSFLSGIMSFDT